jgi:serine/threonine-protein kinase
MRLDARSDLFSLASVLYEALAGRSPFEGGDTAHVWMRIVTETAPPPSSFRPELGEAVDALFAEALAKDPAKRPESAEEWGRRLAEALERVGGARVASAWPRTAEAGETKRGPSGPPFTVTRTRDQ